MKTVYTDSAGNHMTYVFDSRDFLTEKTDKLGNVEKYNYDGLGRRAVSDTAPYSLYAL